MVGKPSDGEVSRDHGSEAEPPAPASAVDGSELDSVRAELRRMGYLHHGFGRFLLQDALKPQRPWRALVRLTAKVGLAAAGLQALVASLVLAAANGSLAQSPFDLIPLFVHLFLPAVLVSGGIFLLLACIMVVGLRVYHVRRIEVAAFSTALVAGLAAVGLALRFSTEVRGGLSAIEKAFFALALLGMAVALVKVVESGLLGLAIRLTDQTPRRRLFSLRWLVAGLLAGLGLLLLPAFLAVRQPPEEGPLNLPRFEGARVLLIGVDGILGGELDYLLAAGELPRLATLLESARRWRYVRPQELPSTFWTTVATGRRGEDHGVVGLDAFQPLGVQHPLARNGPLRWYWGRIAEPLGLAGHRPVLAARRRVPTLWELVSRGGAPVVAVNWWGTYPAAPLPGLVVAHGAYGLLGEEAPGALASESRGALLQEVERSAAALRRAPYDGPLEVALGKGAAEELLDRALLPDRFYVEALIQALPISPRMAAVYLPAPDLATAGWRGGGVALADLLRSSLEQVDRLLEAGDGFEAVALVVDPGRRGPLEGRIYLWSPQVCGNGGEAATPIEPRELSAALLRLLGLPQSRELPAPPAGCAWPSPPDVIAGFGPRAGGGSTLLGGEAYLNNLRSLGYL